MRKSQKVCERQPATGSQHGTAQWAQERGKVKAGTLGWVPRVRDRDEDLWEDDSFKKHFQKKIGREMGVRGSETGMGRKFDSAGQLCRWEIYIPAPISYWVRASPVE